MLLKSPKCSVGLSPRTSLHMNVVLSRSGPVGAVVCAGTRECFPYLRGAPSIVT